MSKKQFLVINTQEIKRSGYDLETAKHIQSRLHNIGAPAVIISEDLAVIDPLPAPIKSPTPTVDTDLIELNKEAKELRW